MDEAVRRLEFARNVAELQLYIAAMRAKTLSYRLTISGSRQAIDESVALLDATRNGGGRIRGDPAATRPIASILPQLPPSSTR